MIKKILNIRNWLILVFSPFSFLIFLVSIVLRPIITIRFGHLLTYRFGHNIKDLEMYLSEKKLNLKNNYKLLDLFFLPSNPANTYLQKISKKYLKVLPKELLYFPYKIMEFLSKKNKFFEKSFINMRDYDYDLNNSFDQINTQIRFSEEEIVKGDNSLEKIGISKNDKIVCLSTRDSNYSLQNLNHPKKFDTKTRSFMDIRNSDIETYKLAATELTKLGYKVVRVGKDTNKKISFSSENIIDYSKSDSRNDFLDIYLAKRCEFVFGDSAGWTQAAVVFRKHIAFANWAPFSVMDFVGKNFYIFKYYYDLKLKRNLTIKEIFDRKLNKLFLFDLEKKNIILKDNTQEEILELVLEVEAKLKGKNDNPENTLRNSKFREFLKKNKFFTREDKTKKYKINSSVGEKYLKKNFII